jgi:prevent-host-death family protein
MDVGIRELKAKLSEHVQRASDGETIVVTDRGRPVARLVPYDTSSAVERGISEGWIEPARRPASGTPNATGRHGRSSRHWTPIGRDALRRFECVAQALRRRARLGGRRRADGHRSGARHVTDHRDRGSAQPRPAPRRRCVDRLPPPVRDRSRRLRARRPGRHHLQRSGGDRRAHGMPVDGRAPPGFGRSSRRLDDGSHVRRPPGTGGAGHRRSPFIGVCRHPGTIPFRTTARGPTRRSEHITPAGVRSHRAPVRRGGSA